MTALELLSSLPKKERKKVREETVYIAHPEAPRTPWKDSDPACEENHPALILVLRDRWWPKAPLDTVLKIVSMDPGAAEIAHVMCSEACAHRVSDPAVAECRRVRLAWARGEASEDERRRAIDAAGHAGSDAESASARDAAWALTMHQTRDVLSAVIDATFIDEAVRANANFWGPSLSQEAWHLVEDAMDALRRPLQTLFPDPCRISVRDALTRWDAAAEQARSLPEFRPKMPLPRTRSRRSSSPRLGAVVGNCGRFR